MSNGRTDSEDYIFAGLFALMIGWTWPVVMAGRLAYIGWMRYVPPFSIPALAIKPIKPPTTYRERKALKAAENEEEQELFQKWVRERELA